MLITLGCVASLVEGSLFGPKQEKPVDFKGLSKWLQTHTKNEDDVDANLSIMRTHLDSLSGGVHRAAEIALELSKGHVQCDDHLVTVLNEASSGHLTTYGQQRVERLLRAPLLRVLDLCSAYIDAKLRERLQALETSQSDGAQTLLKFHRLLNSPDDFGLFGIQLDPISSRLNDYLAKLTEDDPKTKHTVTGESLVFEDAKVFQYAFDRWLLGPCTLFSSTFADLMAGAGSVKLIEDDLSVSFSQQALENIKRLAVTNGVCKHLAHLTAHKRSVLFKEGIWTFDHKEGRRLPRKTLIEKILF